jgi:hypothetical protein
MPMRSRSTAQEAGTVPTPRPYDAFQQKFSSLANAGVANRAKSAKTALIKLPVSFFMIETPYALGCSSSGTDKT